MLYLTITELARESHTSEASVTRLCRTLGCKGYNEFKMALALDIQQGQPAREAGDEIDNVVDESIGSAGYRRLWTGRCLKSRTGTASGAIRADLWRRGQRNPR